VKLQKFTIMKFKMINKTENMDERGKIIALFINFINVKYQGGLL